MTLAEAEDGLVNCYWLEEGSGDLILSVDQVFEAPPLYQFVMPPPVAEPE
jgi:hypothetical protein